MTEEALKVVRLHWGIENKLLWILVVTLKNKIKALFMTGLLQKSGMSKRNDTGFIANNAPSRKEKGSTYDGENDEICI